MTKASTLSMIGNHEQTRVFSQSSSLNHEWNLIFELENFQNWKLNIGDGYLETIVVQNILSKLYFLGFCVIYSISDM